MLANALNTEMTHQSTVRLLVDRARAEDFGDRRGSQRFPFFKPVMIRAEHHRPAGLSAFSRDISFSGIGLILFWPLEVGPVELSIHVGEGEEVFVKGIVHWCRPCGQGWYAAGIGFAPEEAPNLVD